MRIAVLFNLLPGVDPAEYEAWARTTDAPTVRDLPSIASFEVYAATGLLGEDGTPPYAYIEMIEVSDDEAFGADVATEKMQAVAKQFRAYADDPKFVILRDVIAG